MNVYLYQNNTEKILKNAYIGEVWTPTSNTLLYMEFNNNLNDSSWKWVSISWSGIWYEDIWNKKCVKLTSLTGEITWPWNLMAPVWTWDFAVSFYIKPVTSNNVPSVFQSCNTASPRNWCFMFMWFNPSNFTKDRVAFYVNDSNKSTTSVTCTSLVWSWHHFLFTRYNWVCYWYIDGVSVLTPYSDSTSFLNVWYQWILNRAWSNDQKWQNTWCCMSELIVEKQWWDSSKAIQYFDITKSNYWL